ncbi:MAG: ThuA domain-containing protein [Phycisphaeraceae bacterium]|nr:ThuA domain-containing protein [Phycisphaeraceae bacterium]
MTPTTLLLIGAAILHADPPATGTPPPKDDDRPHVVFISGDEEYRSEESLPRFAALLGRDHDVRTTVLHSLDGDGLIDPDALSNIPGLEVLADADLVVMFIRFRTLPDAQLEPIKRYAASGRPLVGFRTATHAFRYPKEDPRHVEMNEAWPRRVFGQRWITHHGNFGDGKTPLTRVVPDPEATHPILRGVEPFDAYSWLYHVEGGGDELAGDPTRLATGTTLKSYHEERHDRFPTSSPVAWTIENPKDSNLPGRVFFTTLGHPYDFRSDDCRRMAVQGMLWAMGREDDIPTTGVKIDDAANWRLTNAGFGGYRKQQRPEAPASREP